MGSIGETIRGLTLQMRAAERDPTRSRQVDGEIEILRPVETVFDLVADERNEPLYNQRLHHVEQLTPGPIGVGTRFRAEVGSRRRRDEMTIEYTEFTRPHVLASTTRLAAMDIAGVLTFEPIPTGTRLRWSWDIRPRGLLRAITPLVIWMGRRQEQVVRSGLKTHLESKLR